MPIEIIAVPEPIVERSKEESIIEEIRKKEERENKEVEELHRIRKYTRERDYSFEALALLNKVKLITNLWRAFMAVLDTEFNFNLLTVG